MIIFLHRYFISFTKNVFPDAGFPTIIMKFFSFFETGKTIFFGLQSKNFLIVMIYDRTFWDATRKKATDRQDSCLVRGFETLTKHRQPWFYIPVCQVTSNQLSLDPK